MRVPIKAQLDLHIRGDYIRHIAWTDGRAFSNP